MSIKFNPQITRREATVLKKDASVVANRVTAAKADGVVTRAEAKGIHDAQAKLGKDSFVLTHNNARMPKLR